MLTAVVPRSEKRRSAASTIRSRVGAVVPGGHRAGNLLERSFKFNGLSLNPPDRER